MSRVRLTLAVAALAVVVAAGVALLGVGVWAAAPPADRVVLGRVLRAQAVFLVAGGVLLLAVLAVVAARLFGRYLLAPRRLAADARLIATVNPGHRPSVAAFPAGLADLADAMHELADRYEAAERDVADRVEAGRADVARERNRLAALMSELAAAVLVCTADGRILLYNAAARRLLEDRPDRPGVVGLGRSVYGVVDRDLVAHLLDRARAGTPAHASTAWGGRLLRVDVAPVQSAESGFVVLVEDVTRRTETTRRRDALLRDLTEGVRASAGAIRGAIENLLDYPDMRPVDRERFAGIVRDEAVALGERVDRLMRGSADDLTDRSAYDDMSATDLLAAVAEAVAAADGPQVTVDVSGSAARLWLLLDGYAAIRAIAALVARLRSGYGLSAVTLGLHQVGRHAALTARWHGPAVDAETLRKWTGEPAGPVGTDTIADVLARHEAQVWSQPEEDDHAYLRLLLPRADDADRPDPDPTPDPASTRASGSAAGVAWSPAATAAQPLVARSEGGAEGRRESERADVTVLPRPEFYDFDLFEVAAADVAWENRALDEIAYTVFDTETTGLLPAEGDEIIAIGAVRIVNGRLLRQETFDRLVDPRRSVPAAARRVHGITPEMLRGQPTIEEVLPAFARFAEDTVLVGHNVSFDLAFLRPKLGPAGVELTQPVLDTLLLSAAVHPDHDEHSMEAIAARLGVDVLGRHSALGDALLTGELFVRLVRLLRQRGIRTVGDAREAARRTYHARIDARQSR